MEPGLGRVLCKVPRKSLHHLAICRFVRLFERPIFMDITIVNGNFINGYQ
jgi:hypothetical protein